MFTSRARRLAAGTLMVAGLTLLAAPLAASAHSGNLFTWAYLDAEGDEPSGFATISQTTALSTTLGAQEVQEMAADGADICTDETAWGIADLEQAVALYTWDHTTGVVGLPVPPVATLADFPGAETVSVEGIWAADSLPGCVKIAFVEYQIDYPEDPTDLITTVSFVDVATGDVHPIVEVPTLNGQDLIEWEGIATDPTTGFTHVFAYYLGTSYYAFVDIPDGEISELRAMAGVPPVLSNPGAPGEADFQPDGKLWMFYSQPENYSLLSFAPASDLTTAVPTVVGDANGTGPNGEHLHTTWTLTYDPAALPATGGELPLGLLAVGGALVLAGAGLAAVRQRRA
jgi:LPXTG-motif cell wall-anchored protein